MEGNNSKRSIRPVGGKQCDATSSGYLQNKLISRVRKKKGSSSLEVEFHGKDTAPKRRCVHLLVEPEPKVQSYMEKIRSLKEKYSCSLVKSRLCKGVQNETEKRGKSVVELESQKVGGGLQKHKKCSTLAPLQKTWCLREKTKSLQPWQKASGNQYEKPETNLFFELEQSLSLQKCKEGQTKRGIGYCISQPESLAPEKCSAKVKSFSVSHLSSGNLIEGTENLVKYPTLKMVEPQETEEASGKMNRNIFTAQSLKNCYVDLGTKKLNSRQLLECVANLEKNKECRSTAEEGKQRIITRAFLKTKICEHDGGKLNWKPGKCVATDPPGCRHGTLAKQIGIGQTVDSVTTVAPVITRVGGSSKKHTDGNDEVVPSAELKIKIKTYREQNPGVSRIQQGKLAEIDVSTSQDCSLQNLVEQSTNLPISEPDETENKESPSSCFGREALVYCGETSFSVISSKELQVLDIKETEKRAEKNSLTVDQDDKSRCLVNSRLPCKVEQNPVVSLLDCHYIKALLKPIANESIPVDKVHCGFLHVASGQTKVLSSSNVMGQNDLNSSPIIVQAGRSFTHKNILVEKGMCQSKKNFSRCRNGKKQFGESKWCIDFEKPSKMIKMSENLEKAEEKVLTNMTIYKVCSQQMADRTSIADFSVASEKLKSNGATLSSLDISGFLLDQDTQKCPDETVSLSDKKVNEAQFVPCNGSDLEKSELLKKDNNVLESKSMEPQIDLTNQVEVEDPTMAKMLASEKTTHCSTNAGDHLKREKRIPKGKTASKVWRKLQLFSCQRVVPISGKNEWPRESCARTSGFVYKNHARNLEREFLRSTDSVANSGQVELHELLTDTSTASMNKVLECKTDLPDKSSASESVLGTYKAITVVGNDTRLFCTDTEGPKQCTSTSTKKVKKSKKTLISPSKNKGSIAKKNIPVDMPNGVFADRSKRETCYQKPSHAKEQVFRTLKTRNLANFKIPLLKNKGIVSPKIEYARTLVNGTCNPLDVLEDTAVSSIQKARATEMSSEANFRHFSKQINAISATVSEEPVDKLDSGFPESQFKETCIYNEGVAVSHGNMLEPSTWQEDSNSLNTGHIEKQMLDSAISEIKGKDDCNNFAQHKDNLYADVLKAYENDVLVLDVIQDDPDLFGDTNEQEVTKTKEYTKSYFDASNIPKVKLELKGFESSQLPRSKHLECSSREHPIKDYGTLKSVADGYVSVIEVNKTTSDSSSGTGSTGDLSEASFEDGQLIELDNLIKNSDSDEKYNSLGKMVAVKEEKTNFQEISKIESAQYVDPASHDPKPPPAVKAAALKWQSAVLKPWMNDFRFPRKGPPLPLAYPNSYESWKLNKNEMTNLGLNGLPYGYCRQYFNTLNGCQRKKCWYLHVPTSGNEKLCNEMLKKYISIGEVVLLQRAVQIFTEFCKEVTTVVHLDSHILNELLTSLLQCCLMKELFCVFHSSITIKILPSVDFLLKVFEHVTIMKIREAVPELIDISCKLVDVGMVLECEHFSYIIKFLNQLQVSSQEITVFTSRFQARHFYKTNLGDFDSAIAEFQHCKEKGDWATLGALYINVRRSCENFDDFEKYSLYIANILATSVKEEIPEVPFCKFASSVYTDSRHNEADTTLLGRIGISVLFSYYRTQQWSKAKKILDTLYALRIPFTFLKGLIGQERSAPRCQIVNIAVEIFLKSGNLDGALWVLRESEWVINTHTWPCDRMDVLNRHNLLCTVASEYITKSCYKEAFEVLKNLPGFQNSCDTLDVSQYSLLFNKLLAACSEGKNLSISSAITEFMLAKNIPIEFHLLRALITTLGRSCLWVKARTCYKRALALGCYPPLEGNLYRKIVLIPSYLTEIEMLLAIEIFLVSNASSIQSPGASCHILQIVLKRCDGDNVRNEDDYRTATDRLIQAARISTPKLFIKHLTVNVNGEQVYSLEYAAALRWLKENMKWAGKAWLFQ
ncbi:protein TOPAZ1 [Tiliqua scincoides]|uniref:protein TOPAZ1 n=1 Tax=Tiliqua scincoides TaxID=71010 RepID=UPI003461A35F